MEKTLLERLSENWKLVKKFDGRKVLGKRGTLTAYFRIKKEIEEALDVYVYVVFKDEKKVFIMDKCPYKIKPHLMLYRINEEGKLVLNPGIVDRVKNVQDWVLSQREEYERMLLMFKEFKEQFDRVSYDYLVRRENTEWLSNELQKLAYELEKK